MVVAVFAVFARGPPVPTGRINIPIRHGHTIREHDGVTLRMEFVFGLSHLVRIILALKLEPEFTLQASPVNNAQPPN
ncbi:unnamed protein product [Clonostachys rhizophaga]|uniref:Uncharacterized protein n=1 Tax=Clonostachys rhizophaga TaxID=160324 RepID=A0A9N9W4Y3_9HYPO|nr:unnamed protein product [Clonostachys rhizophaga]